MAPPDVRRTLYQHFTVQEAKTLLHGPVYLCSCRTCFRLVAEVPRKAEPIDAEKVLDALEHVRAHADELTEPLLP